MKKRTPESVLRDLSVNFDKYGTGMLNGRPVRYLEMSGLFQVGDDDFDRWANSVELEFDIWLPKGQRQLERWINETRAKEV